MLLLRTAAAKHPPCRGQPATVGTEGRVVEGTPRAIATEHLPAPVDIPDPKPADRLLLTSPLAPRPLGSHRCRSRPGACRPRLSSTFRKPCEEAGGPVGALVDVKRTLPISSQTLTTTFPSLPSKAAANRGLAAATVAAMLLNWSDPFTTTYDFRVATCHVMTVPPWTAARTRRPSALQATWVKMLVFPSRMLSGARLPPAFGSVTSQIRTLLSPELTARREPSGLKANAVANPSPGPHVSSRTCFPETASRSRWNAPAPISASRRPSGLYARPDDPGRVSNRRSSRPVPASQTRTSPADLKASPGPACFVRAARRAPSGLNARPFRCTICRSGKGMARSSLPSSTCQIFNSHPTVPPDRP